MITNAKIDDSGIIILPDGRRYVLVLLSKDWKMKNNGPGQFNNSAALLILYIQFCIHTIDY